MLRSILFRLLAVFVAKEATRQDLLRWVRTEFSSWELEDEEGDYDDRPTPRDYTKHPETPEEARMREQLEFMRSQVYSTDYPSLKARTFIPIEPAILVDTTPDENPAHAMRLEALTEAEHEATENLRQILDERADSIRTRAYFQVVGIGEVRREVDRSCEYGNMTRREIRQHTAGIRAMRIALEPTLRLNRGRPFHG